jgi:FKBP-type peptidyl-prolyl cis-trans isomerase
MRTRLIAALAVAALAVAGCGSSNKSSTSTSAATTAKQPTGQIPAVSTDVKKKPTIAKPGGDPPATLQIKDIVKGKGKAAKSGDTVTVDYVGNAWSTGQEFDASWNRGQPLSLPLGAGQVIPGWDQGIVGMKAGGRRELVIPPDLAYGPQGSGPIGPNETLVFVIDMRKIK